MKTMYDNITLYLLGFGALNSNVMDFLPQLLANWNPQKRKGNLLNLAIQILDDRITIYGSLCKFYLGNNFNNMTLDEVKEAIELLSNTLYLPIDDAIVTKLEFGASMTMQHPPKCYTGRLGNMPWHTRLEQPDSVYYRNTLRSFIFYNKVKQSKKHTPQGYEGMNVLRYEVKLSKPAKELGVIQILGKDLYNIRIYKKLVEYWQCKYLEITKIRNMEIAFPSTGKMREWHHFATGIVIQEYGYNEVNKRLREQRADTYEVRKFITQVNNTPASTFDSDLILELDNAIKAVAEKQLLHIVSRI